ncbi:HAD family hydrolase [Cellulosimicrobium cellulans]|uniref:HAD family hydrolase n=1 Tax=Cellulosimicrobium cellulans TaxID=1710 RepID=UPI00380F1C39
MTIAVMFDLWRTLVPLTPERKAGAFRATACALGEGQDDRGLRTAWYGSRTMRETGPLDEYLVWLRDHLGREWSDAMIAEAIVARRSQHFPAFLEPREGVREALEQIRAEGYRTGLVSNCSSDVRAMVEDAGLGALFDELVLSAEVGIMKPDPIIFRCGLELLDCSSGYYCGDGDDGELVGARSAGLVDVLMDLGEGREATYVVKTPTDLLSIVRAEES